MTTSTHRLLAVLVGIAFASLTPGCSGGPQIRTPTGYAVVKTSTPTFRQKLISPDGTVIAVRRFENPDANAGLAFWADALENEKTGKDGMQLAGREEITTERGMAGVLFDFEVGERPAHVRYLIALFVIGDSIHTIEVGGTEESITTGRDTILAAIRSFG